MSKLIVIFSILLISGCSMLIERSAKYSEFALTDDYSREDVVRILGQPLVSCTVRNGHTCDIFQVKGRVFDSGDYWATGAGWVMTLGIHELMFFPWSVWEVASEAISPTDKKLEICFFSTDKAYLNERDSEEISFCGPIKNEPSSSGSELGGRLKTQNS